MNKNEALKLALKNLLVATKHLGVCPGTVQVAEEALAQPEQPSKEPETWFKGPPPFPQNQEWFIAKTIHRERVVLKVLPEEYKYDYTTGDGTYMMASNITHWMQFPDCQFLPPAGQALAQPPEQEPLFAGLIAQHEGLAEELAQQEQERKEFESVVRPVIEWLNAHWHPHVTVVITPTSAELSVGEIAYSTTEFIRD